MSTPHRHRHGSTRSFLLVQDTLTLIHCFLSFAAIKVEARELMAYGQIVLCLARRNRGKGWLAYDSAFHQQVLAGAPLNLDASMMAATVLRSENVGGLLCSLCQACDHIQADCGTERFDE